MYLWKLGVWMELKKEGLGKSEEEVPPQILPPTIFAPGT